MFRVWKGTSFARRYSLDDVLGESTVLGHAAGMEVFAQDSVAATAVEAVVALHGDSALDAGLRFGQHCRDTHRDADVCDDAVTDLEVFDILALLYDLANRLVTRNELHRRRATNDQIGACVCTDMVDVRGTWR